MSASPSTDASATAQLERLVFAALDALRDQDRVAVQQATELDADKRAALLDQLRTRTAVAQLAEAQLLQAIRELARPAVPHVVTFGQDAALRPASWARGRAGTRHP